MHQISDFDFRVLESEASGINFWNAAGHLWPGDRRKYAELSHAVVDFLHARLPKPTMEQKWPLGLSCASDIGLVRNYLFTCMTANATIEAAKRGARRPLVFETTMGSGINCIAATIAHPRARVIAYETDPTCVRVARELFKKFGVEDRIAIYEADVLSSELKRSPDVIINENFYDMLDAEPLLPIARHAAKSACERTVFVPGGVDVGFRTDYKTYPGGRIDFARIPDGNIRISSEPFEEHGRVRFRIVFNLLNHEYRPIFRKFGDELRQFTYNSDVYRMTFEAPLVVVQLTYNKSGHDVRLEPLARHPS